MNPATGEPPAIQWIAVDRLMIDDAYQRAATVGPSESLIRSIYTDWDWRLCGPLMVSARGENGFFVIDGQHRLLAAQRRGDIPHLPCSVSSYASSQDEAQIFVRANRGRKALTPIDIFRASVAAGHSAESEAAQLIGDAGLTIASHTNTKFMKPGAIGNVRGVLTALRRHSRAHVSAALTVMGEAFSDQIIPRAATLFSALLLLFVRNDDGSLDPDLLLETMRTMSAEEWVEFPELQSSSASVRVDTLARLIREEMDEVSKAQFR